MADLIEKTTQEGSVRKTKRSATRFPRRNRGNRPLGKGTGHGPYHTFEVKIADTAHPITAGMKGFTTSDELWHRMQKHPDQHPLCTAFSAKEKRGSGQDEPVTMVTKLGKGRGFNLVLGHDVKAMQNLGWQALMRRGVEWAPINKVTIPLLLHDEAHRLQVIRPAIDQIADKP